MEDISEQLENLFAYTANEWEGLRKQRDQIDREIKEREKQLEALRAVLKMELLRGESKEQK